MFTILHGVLSLCMGEEEAQMPGILGTNFNMVGSSPGMSAKTNLVPYRRQLFDVADESE